MGASSKRFSPTLVERSTSPKKGKGDQVRISGTAYHCTTLYCTVLYYTVLHCTVLHCTVLHCAVLYCTALRNFLRKGERGIR